MAAASIAVVLIAAHTGPSHCPHRKERSTKRPRPPPSWRSPEELRPGRTTHPVLPDERTCDSQPGPS
jgi:hypothetical protein